MIYHNLIPESQIGKYVIKGLIIKTNIASIYEAVHFSNFQHVQIKCVSRQIQKFCEDAYNYFLCECDILKKIKCENVINWVDSFQDANAIYLVTEFCNQGTLQQMLEKTPILKEQQAINILKQLAIGLTTLHQKNIIHRELSWTSIQFKDNVVKISDLGYAKLIKNEQDLLTSSGFGNPQFLAPEQLEEEEYGIQVDMYSLGVIFYRMLFGGFPFQGNNEMQLLTSIKQQVINWQMNQVQISKQAQELIQQMLMYDPKKRITWSSLYNHPILTQVVQGIDQFDYTKSINQLVNNKIDNQQGNIYKNLENSQSSTLTIQKSQINFEESKEVKLGQDEINKALYNLSIQKQREQDIIEAIEKYLADYNTLILIGKAVFKIHQVPQLYVNKLNTYYPCYFVLKYLKEKLYISQTQIEKKQNIYNFQHDFNYLLQDKRFKELIQQMQDIYQNIDLYYISRHLEMKDLMKQTPDPEIIKEIDQQFCQTTLQYFKISLIQYILQIQKIISLKDINKENQAWFINHAVEIINCLIIFLNIQYKFVYDQKEFDQVLLMSNEKKLQFVENKFNDILNFK